MKATAQDRHSLFLLLSLVVFLVLFPFLEHGRIGGQVLEVLFIILLIAATLELSNQLSHLRGAILLVICAILVHVGDHFYPTIRPLSIASHSLVALFFGFVCVGLFAYLGRRGAITSGRLYASVSLYLILGMFWFSIYSLVETVYPGSFVQMAPTQVTNLRRDALLYFSLITLTTVGYGDIVAVSPPARLFAALEGVTGVLYIAITVARLVAAYQSASNEDAS